MPDHCGLRNDTDARGDGHSRVGVPPNLQTAGKGKKGAVSVGSASGGGGGVDGMGVNK
jgi:hypothetical protein